jgi:hypothetical protein
MQLEPEKKYNVVLTGNEIALVQNALAELPFKFTAGLIQSLPEKISEIKETKLEKVEAE